MMGEISELGLSCRFDWPTGMGLGEAGFSKGDREDEGSLGEQEMRLGHH